MPRGGPPCSSTPRASDDASESSRSRRRPRAGPPRRGRATRGRLRLVWAAQVTAAGDAGSWDWLNFGLAPWEACGSRAFGAAVAAIAVGSAPGYLEGGLDEGASRGVALLRGYLRRRFPEE